MLEGDAHYLLQRAHNEDSVDEVILVKATGALVFQCASSLHNSALALFVNGRVVLTRIVLVSAAPKRRGGRVQ